MTLGDLIDKLIEIRTRVGSEVDIGDAEGAEVSDANFDEDEDRVVLDFE